MNALLVARLKSDGQWPVVGPGTRGRRALQRQLPRVFVNRPCGTGMSVPGTCCHEETSI